MYFLAFQIDGDTDSSSVQREFERVIRQHIENLGGNEVQMNGIVHGNTNFGPLFNRNDSGVRQNKASTRSAEFVEDLEDTIPGVIPTISNQVSNHVALSNGQLGKHTQARAAGKNGHVPNGRSDFRSMLEDAEMDSHI